MGKNSKTAIISDIHSNLEALDAVLDDIDNAGINNVISLGDQIGYGADPEAVIQRLIERKVICTLGNHELALIDDRYLKRFNKEAALTIDMHRNRLSSDSMKFISEMPRLIVSHGGRFLHGTPPDSITEYVSRISEKRLTRIMAFLKQSIAFTGHTHLMQWFELYNDKSQQDDAFETKSTPESAQSSQLSEKCRPGTESSSHGSVLKKGSFEPNDPSPLTLDPACRYLVNAGSIGQPRDHCWKAKYVIWDRDEGVILPRYIEYDNTTAAEKIEKTGLPARFARQLM
ncbi:conserved hypothetical protein [Desulfamplus magnetovallimortis]|uniref:Calcineurin-like phosphoesterase domain-containing protein n=1 Tax=Desulfamplus magnetovallimortis TaxID=1246637 RepID=A0A1W1HGE1_9BACT|nr:metallophosphoesterase [Desulfamplus magnetovallimortis]SLM31581.1 conserved hypothetical protein [Desulfamplus magnetovallimortis]